MIEILAILLGAFTGFVIANRKEIGSWIKQVRRPQTAADMMAEFQAKQLYNPPWPAKGGNTGPRK